MSSLESSETSTLASFTSSSSTVASSTEKLKCDATCCISDHLYVPQNQADFKLSRPTMRTNGHPAPKASGLTEQMDKFSTYFGLKLGDERLERELIMLSDYFLTVDKEKNLNLKRITKISMICELLNAERVGKTLFCEYRKLLLLHLITPATTATAECSFSALNQIKTHLRRTMTQQRLNHVIIPHIHKEKLDLLDPNRICSEFISKNQNGKTFFGHE